MSVFEIIAGVLLIIACIVLILVVLAQEGKGQGLSSVITGGGEMSAGDGRGHGKERQQERITRFAAIAFAVLAVLVNVLSAING